MERYEYIIQLGKSLPFKDEFKTDSNVMLPAKVWLQGENTMKKSPQTVTRF
jgi:sulfur transfer protein SufE